LPVSEEIAELWGKLAASAKQRGTPLAVVDGIIAAPDLQRQLTLVTRNFKDFANLGVDHLNFWEP
jgi:predicted nucleic acid-binding protein